MIVVGWVMQDRKVMVKAHSVSFDRTGQVFETPETEQFVQKDFDSASLAFDYWSKL